MQKICDTICVYKKTETLSGKNTRRFLFVYGDFIKGKIKLPVDEEELKKIVKTINLYNEEIKMQKEKLKLIENQQKTIIKLLTFGIVRVV